MKIERLKTDREDIDMMTVEGINTAQKYGVEKVFKKLKNSYGPERVIEIGTHHGGFALLLRTVFDCPIYTFDINVCPNAKLLKQNDIQFIHADVFEHDALENLLVRGPGKVLILCDGGHKWNEYTYFAPKIKRHDLIGAHDYSPDGEHTDWVTSEINGEQMRKFSEDNNVVEIMEEFNKYAWTIREKK